MDSLVAEIDQIEKARKTIMMLKTSAGGMQVAELAGDVGGASRLVIYSSVLRRFFLPFHSTMEGKHCSTRPSSDADPAAKGKKPRAPITPKSPLQKACLLMGTLAWLSVLGVMSCAGMQPPSSSRKRHACAAWRDRPDPCCRLVPSYAIRYK